MNMKLLNVVLFSATTLAAGLGTNTVYATDSLGLTVKTNVTTGTCSATVLDGDTPASTIAIGSVGMADIPAPENVATSTKAKAFKVRFSNCAGLPNNAAVLHIGAKAGPNKPFCGGTAGDKPQYKNNSASTGAAKGIGLILTGTTTPEQQFRCTYSTVDQATIDVSGAKGGVNVDYPMTATLVKVNGEATYTAGDFLSETVFKITYN